MKGSKMYISEKALSSRYICHLIVGEDLQQKLNQIKKRHGKIRVRGRHPDAGTVMQLNGWKPNWTKDIPVWLAYSVAVYKR